MNLNGNKMEEKEFENLIEEILSYGCENEWIEFKENNYEPRLIGEYLSALSNSACLHKTKQGYLVFGIDDSCSIKGTSFEPKKQKGKGNENLENWLLRLLNPRIDFQIIEGTYKKNKLVVFKIDSAKRSPTEFDGKAYIRVGEYKKLLKDFPEKERTLWRIINEVVFEGGIALDKLNEQDVLTLIDYPEYFSLMKLKLPQNREAILDKLEEEKLVFKKGKKYSISNLGAILFAKDLNQFPKLSRKKVRVIFYVGNSRTGAIREREHKEGYAILFKDLIQYILDQLPANEVIKTALREEVFIYPQIAIRELLANTLIHQDFFEDGTSPMIEFFDNRVEFTNPGEPLIETNRFIDHAPISRNDKLAGFMRRVKICEEAGTGIDKVIESVEIFQLPAPEFIKENKFVKVILYGHRDFSEMTKDDRIRACWQHCVLKYISRQFMTNASLRERFKLKGKNDYVQVSKIIRACIDKGYIKQDESKRYIPAWA
jgi:predicted HTH transcriptional regulator